MAVSLKAMSKMFNI